MFFILFCKFVNTPRHKKQKKLLRVFPLKWIGGIVGQNLHHVSTKCNEKLIRIRKMEIKSSATTKRNSPFGAFQRDCKRKNFVNDS